MKRNSNDKGQGKRVKSVRVLERRTSADGVHCSSKS